MRLTHGSLFTGVGGIDLGFQCAGIQTVWQVENGVFVRKVLEKRFPGVTKFPDVRQCGENKPNRLETVDIISGGFPCQDESSAGKKRGLGTPDNPSRRSGLWFEYLRIVRELRPRWVLIENVSRLLHTEDGDRVLGDMEEAGYSCVPLVLGAEILGAPHKRERVWILCHRNDAPGLCNFEAVMTGQWALPPECQQKMAETIEKWNYWKHELSRGGFSPTVTTPTATEILVKEWDAERFYQTKSGRMRKRCKTGTEGSMSWAQEMASRSVKQGNPLLMPTPEACEEMMGYPARWSALGDEDADAYSRILRGVQEIPDYKDRQKAIGNAVVPQIPMLIGCFIQEYESRAAAVRNCWAHSMVTVPAYAASHTMTSESREDSMSKIHPAHETDGSPVGRAPAGSMTGSASAAAPQSEDSGLDGEHRLEAATDAQRPSQAGAGQPMPASIADGSSSAGTHGNGGIDVIGDAEAYLRTYLSFPDGKYFLPLALFSALEHCWDECFDEVPYLSVGAAVKSAGKTRVLELLSFLAGEEKAILVDGSITEAALYTEIGQGKTILIDESERLRTPRSPFRPILNGGYRRGQFVYRKAGGQNVKFPSYCPKVFSHIGDVYDSLRDRCIVVHMQRTMGGRRKEYSRSVAQAEGHAIGGRMQDAISTRLEEIRTAYRHYHELYPSLGFLRDRDREIWKPLFSLCQVLAPFRIPELDRSAADIAALKTVPVRPFECLAQEEKESEETEYAERLLVDAISVMTGTDRMATGELARRLRELPTSPWRTYRGSGIAADASGAMVMASLLKRFGVEPRTIRMRPKSELNSTAKGYRLADLIAGAGRAGVPLGGGKGRNPVTSAAMATEVACGPSDAQGELHGNGLRPGCPAITQVGCILDAEGNWETVDTAEAGEAA